MRGRDPRHQRQARERQVWNGASIDGYIGIAAPWRDSNIHGVINVSCTTPAGKGEDPTVIRLALVLERECAISIRRAIGRNLW